MTPQKELIDYLQLLASMLSEAGLALKAHGYAYDSPIDFLLQHGQWYQPQELPCNIWRGAPKSCYGNAIVGSILHDLRYVEGYGLVSFRGPTMPFEHAWLTDAQVHVYEVTWPTAGLAYFGVEFSVERADDCTWNGDATVLSDWRRKYPLLRERWSGEPIGLYWPRSRRLELLRAAKVVRMPSVEN